ncbi:MAG: sensor histidine kinase [Lewinellaceae bacterium]|nr:sensor histidine kinase [Lewinellaceae bacterium]
MDLLRAQLQPHFLFNVLNNLLAQVDQQQNPALAESIDRLSGLLRYIVYETAAPTVSIRREIDFLLDYAALQRTRFTPEELDFQFTVEGEALDQPIATGLLLPFLENAFKHGVYPEETSWIVVKVVINSPQEIQFSIRNSRHPRLSPDFPTAGFGLQATRERLALVYPNRHALDIHESASDYSIHLTLQTDARPDRR